MTTTPSTARDMDDMIAWLSDMRRREPVSFDERTGRWHVFQYEDARRVLTDFTVFSNDLSAFIPENEALEAFQKGNFQGMDPPRHRHLRGLVSQVFTPRFVAGLRPRLEAVTTELLDAVRDQDEFDLIADLAYPLPVIVIAEVLGVPAEDRSMFQNWASTMLVDNGVDAILSEAGVEAMVPVINEMNEYLLAHIRRHRARPDDGLISKLLAVEEEGRRLGDQEIIGFLSLLLVAGHLTTTALLGNSVMCLGRNSAAAADLRADPSLSDSMIEEVLRYRSPFPWVDRVTKQNVAIGGREIPEGVMVDVWISSANRDPEVFSDPELFDIRRAPNHHLAFGKGIHFCLGAPLARLETKVALGQLLDRYPRLVVPPEEQIEYHDPYSMQGVKRLPLTVVPA
ncbi:cytochrome P450 [Amycolatopsis sp. cmx-11-12]|uniref:cytochrome P450 n=1 Tax=Amycolatopsis sp. cmx-11-12 TaxID=2785795 RepID=UPI0039182089